MSCLIILVFLLGLAECSRVLAFSVAAPAASPSSADVATGRLESLLDGFPDTERHCSVGVTKFGRGLVANRDFQPGQVALRIPLECAIDESDMARNEDEWID
jgi:hypothetical protein